MDYSYTEKKAFPRGVSTIANQTKWEEFALIIEEHFHSIKRHREITDKASKPPTKPPKQNNNGNAESSKSS